MHVSPQGAPDAPLDGATPLGGPPPRPKRWLRRLVVVTSVALVICLIGAGAVFGYVGWRFGQIRRVSIPGLPRSSGGAPQTILVVGSDSRAGLKGADVRSFGSTSQSAGQRSDTMMLIRLDPRQDAASLLSVPRDLWVPIAGRGYSQRINTAFDVGPSLLVQTVEASLGVQVNHFVEVDFNGFRQIVNSLGGVKLWYPEPVRDSFSGLNITTPGCYNLSGDMALSLVRSRHLQYHTAGGWHDEAASDLARIRRQQSFVKSVARKAQAAGPTDVASLNGVIGGLVDNLTVDSAFSRSQMLSLLRRYRGFNPDRLTTATLPTTPGVVGGADVLFLDKAAAQPVIDEFSRAGTTAQPSTTSTTALPFSPAAIRVTVANASGVVGRAASATNALEAAGFATGTPTTAAHRSAQSVIRYPLGDEAAAGSLEAQVGGHVRREVDSSLPGASLLLTIGTDFTGITRAPGAPGAPGASSGAPTAPAPEVTAPAATSATPPFPGPHGADPAPPGSGC